MIAPEETFRGTYPFAPHYFDGSGFRMHYVDEGAGDPIVLLHGEPSWSYLYREIIPRLSARHRVIAPDFMGFGKSETPAKRDYGGAAQSDALEGLLLDLDLRDATLVLHDWGGPIGGAFALRHPARVARIVVANSVMPLGLPGESERLAANVREARYFCWMRGLWEAGTMDTVLGELGTIVPAVMLGLQGVVRRIDETWMRAYSAPFATPAECAGAIALPKSIVSESSVPPPTPPDAVAALRGKPAMMLYGMRDRVLLPHHFIPIFEDAFPGAPVFRLDDAGHFLQEDAPETVALLIDAFCTHGWAPRIGTF